MADRHPRHLSADQRPRRPWTGVALAVLAAVVLGTVAVIATQIGWAPARDSSATPAPTTTTAPPATTSTTAATTTTTAPPRRATIVFGGDVLIHSPVYKAAATGTGYDFTPMLAPVAARLSAADLAICHLEVTLARPGQPLSSYPRFRAPPELAADLAEAGFDGCSVASNHALDFGVDGVAATLDALDAAGLQHAGTARSAEEDAQPARYEAGGIQVAQLSYAYGFNGFTRPAGQEWVADQIDPSRILADAKAARAGGAELVIVSLHWGDEYHHDIRDAQRTVAEALAAEPGVVDLVVGSHAHVVQPISKVGDLWVVWGMGNLLSNNSPGCCLRDATDGVLVTVTIGDLGGRSGKAGVTGVAFTPTWNERQTFRVLPVAESLADGGTGVTDADLRASYDRTVANVLADGGADLGVVPDPPVP